MRVAGVEASSEARVPAGWQRVLPPAPDPVAADLWAPSVARVPVRRFVSTEGIVEASKPVEIRFTHEEDLYIADNEMLNIQGTGETIEEAYRDFVVQVVYFFRRYRGLSEKDVMGEASRLRRLYLDEFREIESS